MNKQKAEKIVEEINSLIILLIAFYTNKSDDETQLIKARQSLITTLEENL